jgi:hypothetical protein
MLKTFFQFSNAFIDKKKHLSNLMIATRIQKLLIKNQIKIVHYMPGRIRLKSPIWKNQDVINSLVDELEKESKILSVVYTKETGSLLIQFDKSPVEDYSQIELWLKKAEYIAQSLMAGRG